MPVIKINNEEFDDFLHIRVEGMLTQDDYTRELIPWFTEICEDKSKRVNVLMDCRDLVGFSLLAMFEDSKLGMHLKDQPMKMALVVEEGGFLYTICSTSLFQYTTKYFDFEMAVFTEEEEGKIWLFKSEGEKVDLSIQTVNTMKEMKMASGKKFLICIDGGVNSVQSLVDAIELMDIDNDEIHIMSIYSPTQGHFFSKLKTAKAYQKNKDEAKENLKHAKNLILGDLNEENLSIHLHLIESDDPKKQIVDLANELSINYIVLGNSKSSMSKSILGRVSTYVLQNATCTVIISRDIEQEKEQENNNNN